MKRRSYAAAAAVVSAAMSVSAFGAVDLKEARETALEAVGVSEEEAIFTEEKEDLEDKTFELEFFIPGQVKVEMEIDAGTGRIIEQSVELWEDEDDLEYASFMDEADLEAMEKAMEGEISLLKARAVVLKDSGLKADELEKFEAEKDTEDGRSVYEIEFTCKGDEYSYEIDAQTGEILEKDIEREDDD